MDRKINDYYYILEVHMLAGEDAIKNSYRRLCKLHHPDNGCETEYLNKLNEAYEVLADENKRKEYNKYWKKIYMPNENILNDFSEAVVYENIFRPLKKIVNEYMFLIKNKDYETAYTLLSKENKDKIFKKDFITWQKLIGEIYFLIDYQCVTEDFGRDVTMKIKVTELNLLVNRVEEDVFLRKLVYENFEWKILLNDIDVKNIIRKYKRIIEINKKNRKIMQKKFMLLNEEFDSRQVSFDVFLNNCEYEFCRFERYGRIFSIMTIELFDFEPTIENEIMIERLLEKNTRKIDSFTKYENNKFLVLMPETCCSGCDAVKSKIKGLIDSSYIETFSVENKFKSVKEYLNTFLDKPL